MTLTGTTRNVLLAITQTTEDRLTELAIQELADTCLIAECTVRRHIKALRALHLIEVGRPCRGVPYSFTVLPLAHKVLGKVA